MSDVPSTIVFTEAAAKPPIKRPTLADRRPCWRPILEGEAAGRARAAIAGIDEDLARRGAQLVHDPSLAGGSAGVALFYAYLVQAGGGEQADARGLDWLDHSIAGMCRQTLSPALHSGFSGVAWTLAHVAGDEDRVDDQQYTIVDEALAAINAHGPVDSEYDLINGLVGLGVYALERLPSPVATACLEQVIQRLARQASVQPDGICWWTPSARLPEFQRQQFPGGYANLGVAHGVPGVIGLLARAVASGVAVEQSRRLLAGAVEWLLAQQLRDHPSAHFAYTAGDRSEASRLAWCYGDLGISVVLLSAARAVNETSWERQAVRIARTAARRTVANSGIQDAGLCHGSAGAAHLFNRLYQATGDGELLTAARRWFDETFKLHSDEHGVGGFAVRGKRGAEAGRWLDEPGFLEGAAGVALALLAATSDVEPNWDRVLLAS